MQKALKLAARLLCVVIAAPIGVQYARTGRLPNFGPRINKGNVNEVVREVAPTLPRSLPNGARWTHLETDGTTLIYHIQFTHFLTAQIDTYRSMEMANAYVKKWFCEDDEAAINVLSEGTAVRAIYYDSAEQPFGSAEVVPGDCGF